MSTTNNQSLNYKEVPVPNTSYSKIVNSDGNVAVLYSPSYSGGWSTQTDNKALKKQLVLDSRLVLFFLSPEYQIKKKSKVIMDKLEELYTELINQVFLSQKENDNDVDDDYATFQMLSECIKVKFIPENKYFRITADDTKESIEIIDNKDNLYS